ncbi:MAG: glycosyltransferase family 4 protein [Thermoleophilia bacterium]
MRICVVTVAGHGVGGMQDHTRELARGLARRGHDVQVVTARHPEGIEQEVIEGATWHYVPAESTHPSLPRRHPFWHPLSYTTFRRLHEARPFDVVHSESSSAIGLLERGVHRHGPMAAKLHGNVLSLLRASARRARRGGRRSLVPEAKLSTWTAGLHLSHGHLWRMRPLEWMVPSHHELAPTRRSLRLDPSRGHVVPNGIDPSVFRPRARADVRAGLGLGPEPLVASVGRLDRDKGVHHAIDALHALTDHVPDLRLVLVGEGPEGDGLARRARELGVADRVTFAGSLGRDGVAATMAAADVFLFPTERAEAAPLVLPQAMATGVPVIASRIGGIVEVAGPRSESAVLVPPGDLRALVEALRHLLADETLRERIGRAGRERVLAEYSLEGMIDRTLAVYACAARRLAAGRGDGGRG